MSDPRFFSALDLSQTRAKFPLLLHWHVPKNFLKVRLEVTWNLRAYLQLNYSKSSKGLTQMID